MAEYPIIMKQKNNQGQYDILYPKTLGSQVEGTIPSSQITGTFPSSSITGQFPASQIDDIYTKGQTLTQATATLFGLGTNVVPDDVFAYLGKYAQHWWRRRTPEKKYFAFVEQTYNTSFPIATATSNPVSWSYSDEYEGDPISGVILLRNPESVLCDITNTKTEAVAYVNQNLTGKYFTSGAGSTPPESPILKLKSAITEDMLYSDGRRWNLLSGNSAEIVATSAYDPAGAWEYVQSTNRSAYPDSGEQGGYEYEYLGIPFENAVGAPNIETGSYFGTGTYGSSNPNSLTFGFKPKLIIVQCITDVGMPSTMILPCAALDSGSYKTGGFMYKPNDDGSISPIGVVAKQGDTEYSIKWYSNFGTQDGSNQMNYSGQEYKYFALG